ncbi:hypothetical protein JTB14_011565 [Gonioctena quinquepunctata]|nr:hypothetical protein JTB14_011565 [Gonioctena quinquepunctata]
MFLTSSLKYDFLAVSIAFIVIIFAWYRKVLNYWKRKGIDGLKPSFPFGNMKEVILQKESLGVPSKDFYFDMKAKGLRHGGAYFFTKPEYIPIDLDLMKAILQRDFQYFNSHGGYVNEKSDPLSPNLFNLDGAKWKQVIEYCYDFFNNFPTEDWKSRCAPSKKFETNYMEKEPLLDAVMDNFIITINGESDDESNEETDDENYFLSESEEESNTFNLQAIEEIALDSSFDDFEAPSTSKIFTKL